MGMLTLNAKLTDLSDDKLLVRIVSDAASQAQCTVEAAHADARELRK
jgi:hypothetical protein